MAVLGEGEYLVYDYAGLAAAITAADSRYITLGDNIELSGGITVPANKAELVIDGTHEGVRYSLTDMNSIVSETAIGIRATSSITITFKDIELFGHNYFGIPYVSESSLFIDTSGVTVVYENVEYTGIQLTYNPDGLTRYTGCIIRITASGAQEVGEVCRVEFDGVNVIEHDSTTDAVFWFRGAADAAYLRLLPGASLTVTTANYFMYCRRPKLFPTTNRPVAIDIRQGASFTLTSNHGISNDYNHLASSFSVGADAAFTYIQQTANDTYSSLYIEGSFTINEGARVYMQADYNNSYPLITFTRSAAQPINVNCPKSFVLYNKAAAPIALSSGVTRSFTLQGGQINFWTSAAALPDAGGFTDTPYRKWNRPDWSDFNITGTVASGSTSATGTSLTPEEQALLHPIGDLSFQTARVISVGDLPIAADMAADDGRPISGFTDPGANMIISYTVSGADFEFTPTAEMDGSFLAEPAGIIPAGTYITIKSNVPFLITVIQTIVRAVVGEVFIERVPAVISFDLNTVSTSPLLLGRKNPSDWVTVQDDRPTASAWTLLVSAAGPLTTIDGETLEDALVFKDSGGVIWDLGETPVAVFEGGDRTGETIATWPPGEGILVRVSEPIRSSASYSATLSWELEVT